MEDKYKNKALISGHINANADYVIKNKKGNIIETGCSDTAGVIITELLETPYLLESKDISINLDVNEVGVCSFQNPKARFGQNVRMMAESSVMGIAAKFVGKQLLSGAIGKVGSDAMDKLMQSAFGPDETQKKLNDLLKGQQEIKTLLNGIQKTLDESFGYVNQQFENLFKYRLKVNEINNKNRIDCLMDAVTSVENTLLSDMYTSFWDADGEKYETEGKSEEEVVEIYSSLWSDLAKYGKNQGYTILTLGSLEYLFDHVFGKIFMESEYELSSQMKYLELLIESANNYRNEKIITKEFIANTVEGISMVPGVVSGHEKESDVNPSDGLFSSILYTGYLEFLHIITMITELNFFLINFGLNGQYKSVEELLDIYKDTSFKVSKKVRETMGEYGWPDISWVSASHDNGFSSTVGLNIIQATIFDKENLPSADSLAYSKDADSARKKCFSHIQQKLMSEMIGSDQAWTSYFGCRAEYKKDKSLLATFYGGGYIKSNEDLFVLEAGAK